MNQATKKEMEYKVILFNDDVHCTASVFCALCLCLNLPIDEANELTNKAHNQGHATICITHYERAEHVCFRLQDECGLDVVIEPCESEPDPAAGE